MKSLLNSALILTLTMPLICSADEIFCADPTVFVENGKYYLTGTQNGSRGFRLYSSDNLETWQEGEEILRAGVDTYGTKGFWAPQIIKDGHEYLLTYTANEQTCVAKAPSLTGHYTQSTIGPIDGSEKNIDSFLFRDDDGKWYLYHVRFDHGNFLWVAEYDMERGCIVEGTLTPCFRNTQPWEATEAYVCDPIMEGPAVLKMGEKYYLFYSANHFLSPDYAVGYAVSDSPTGPWVKNPDNPVIHSSIVGENGSGHGDWFIDNDGELRYVYHVHYSQDKASPRRTRIVTLRLTESPSGEYKITADPSTVIKPVVAR